LLRRDHAACGTSITPVFMLVAGAAVAIGVGMACCASARSRLRTFLLTEPSAELAKRIRLATRAGVREARRQFVVVREPSRERLAGVEGLAESL